MLRRLTLAAVFVGAFGLFSSAQAQVGYGVTSAGQLFRFDVNNTGSVTNVGAPLPFVPEGIDFRPGTNTLYALDVGAVTTQLYTVSAFDATATPVGSGFPSQVSGQPSGNYSLLGATIGFDFNPRTLQADGSVRIRVVASNGTNLRLNSDTGQVAAVDTPLDYPDTDPNAAATPMVDAAAYTNSARSTSAAAGTTTLYVMDFGTDDLATQNPPNAGQLNTVGPFGASVNADSGIGFDIYTDPASVDDGIGGDRAYAVLRRPDAPMGNEGKYFLYDVNLSTGQITGGRLVGGGVYDFTGGFAVLVPAPEALIISEYRLAGPGGDQDEFVEVYNNSNSPHIVSDPSGGYAIVSSSAATLNTGPPTLRCAIPNATVIPARGHFLCANSGGYSLSDYGGTGAAIGNGIYSGDIPLNDGIALFSTSNPANFNAGTRLDAVGSKLVTNSFYREGAGHSQVNFPTTEHSFVRRLPGGCTGFHNDPNYAPNNRNCVSGAAVLNTPGPQTSYPQDTGDNLSDFLFVDPGGTGAGSVADLNLQQRLGAPGPENMASPVANNSRALSTPNPDLTKGASAAPNRVRDTTCALTGGVCVANASLGYLDIRKRIQNNTGAPVTRLRFRVVDISVYPTCGGPLPACADGQVVADVRAITSSGFTITVDDSQTCATTPGASSTTAPCTAPVGGTTLEQPPVQANGGGFNSSMSTNVSMGSPLLPGQSVVVNWRLGVEKNGKFRFFVTVEALPFQ